MTRIHKIATLVVMGTLILTGKAMTAKAAEDPVAGISVVLEGFYQNAGNSDEEAVQSLLAEISSGYENLAFAQVSSYVNIRSKAGEEGEILGKLYNNSAATIISQENDWYKITSGSVTGYIKGEFLVTGEEAKKLAGAVGTRLAIVNTTTLKVRESASLDSPVLTLVAIGDDLKVAEEQEGWVKVQLDESSYGYVSSDYVKLETVYEEAVSIEEEQARLAEEAAADRQEGNTSSGGTSFSYNQIASDNNPSSLGSEIVAFALQFEGNPYVWGGTSLTNGTDCSGFTQSVFAHFGISIPRTSRTQATGGKKVDLGNLHKGDLIFYARNGTINHVAIYIGNGKVISASSPETGIRVTSLYYRQPYKAVRYIN